MHAYSLKRILSNPPLVVSLCSSLSTLLFFSFVKSVALFLCPDSLGSRWLIAPGKPPRLLTTATSWPSSRVRARGGEGSGFRLIRRSGCRIPPDLPEDQSLSYTLICHLKACLETPVLSCLSALSLTPFFQKVAAVVYPPGGFVSRIPGGPWSYTIEGPPSHPSPFPTIPFASQNHRY